MTILGRPAASTPSAGSPIKGMAMVVAGLLAGTDVDSGYARFTFGVEEFLEGVNLVVLAMGMFGVGEIFWNFTEGRKSAQVAKVDARWRALMPSRKDRRDGGAFPIGRGAGPGAVIGIRPGAIEKAGVPRRRRPSAGAFGAPRFDGVCVSGRPRRA